jgi:hypothetical protein
MTKQELILVNQIIMLILLLMELQASLSSMLLSTNPIIHFIRMVVEVVEVGKSLGIVRGRRNLIIMRKCSSTTIKQSLNKRA